MSECMHTDWRRVHSVDAEKRVVCVGWYCPQCKQFFNSIGRERQFPIEINRR